MHKKVVGLILSFHLVKKSDLKVLYFMSYSDASTETRFPPCSAPYVECQKTQVQKTAHYIQKKLTYNRHFQKLTWPASWCHELQIISIIDKTSKENKDVNILNK